jgi:hypothetical protein
MKKYIAALVLAITLALNSFAFAAEVGQPIGNELIGLHVIGSVKVTNCDTPIMFYEWSADPKTAPGSGEVGSFSLVGDQPFAVAHYDINQNAVEVDVALGKDDKITAVYPVDASHDVPIGLCEAVADKGLAEGK